MRIHVLQHVPFEGLGSISPWTAEKGYEAAQWAFTMKANTPGWWTKND